MTKVLGWLCIKFTSEHFRAVSMARPGPKPVRDFTLVEEGSGRLHWAKTEKANDLRCCAYIWRSLLRTGWSRYWQGIIYKKQKKSRHWQQSHNKSIINGKKYGSLETWSYLNRNSIANVRGQELEHFKITAEQTQGPHTGVAWHWARATVCLLVAEGVHDVNHNGRWICDAMRLPVRRHAYLFPFQSAKKA